MSKLQSVIEDIRGSQQGAMLWASIEEEEEGFRMDRNGAGRKRKWIDVQVVLLGAIQLVKAFRGQKGLTGGGGVAPLFEMWMSAQLPDHAAQLSILQSSTLATMLVRTRDLVVVESSKAVAEYMPWEGMRGYEGHSLWNMTCVHDVGVLRNFKDTISARKGGRIRLEARLRLKRLGVDARTNNRLCKYVWQTIELAHISEDLELFLVTFQPSPKDLEPMSSGDALWERMERLKYACWLPPKQLPGLPDDVDISPQGGSFMLEYIDRWIQTVISLETFFAPRTIFAWNVEGGEDCSFACFASLQLMHGFSTGIQPVAQCSFKPGSEIIVRLGPNQKTTVFHFICWEGDAMPEDVIGGEALFFDGCSGRLRQVGSFPWTQGQAGGTAAHVFASQGDVSPPFVQRFVMQHAPPPVPGSREEFIKSTVSDMMYMFEGQPPFVRISLGDFQMPGFVEDTDILRGCSASSV